MCQRHDIAACFTRRGALRLCAALAAACPSAWFGFHRSGLRYHVTVCYPVDP